MELSIPITRDYLTIQSAAALTGYEPEAIRYPIKLGLLRFIRIGHKVLVGRTSLRQYMKGGAGGRPRGPADRNRGLHLFDA